MLVCVLTRSVPNTDVKAQLCVCMARCWLTLPGKFGISFRFCLLLHLLDHIYCHRNPKFPSLPYETRNRLNQRPLNVQVPILPNKVPRYTVGAAMLDPNLMGQPSVSACSRLHTIVMLPIRRPWKSWPTHGIFSF